MGFHAEILVQCTHCDIYAKDAFGPSSWGLPFGPEPVLKDFSWTWKKGEVWAVLGSNTSGKDALAYALAGEAVVRPREMEGSWVNKLGENDRKGIVLSFAEAEKALRYALRFDESDFVEGGQHPGLTVEGFLGIGSLDSVFEEGRYQRGDLSLLWETLGLEAVRTRGLKYLSTGELRKVLLFKAFLGAPSLLICEDLLEGLDARSRLELVQFFQRITEGNGKLPEKAVRSFSPSPGGDLWNYRFPAVLFLCDREDQILPSVTHILRLREGRVEQAGRWEGRSAQWRMRSIFVSLSVDSSSETHAESAVSRHCQIDFPGPSCQGAPLIRMKNIRVAYADRVVFEGLDFELYPGEHCFIQGPNGCGKSTLVKLITGDHPQGWMNDIVVAGIPRQIGERVQDVRMQTSLVSHELHRSFLSLEEISTLEVVLSGFFGTVGLYEPVGEERIAEAEEALRICGLTGYENRMFKDLPWGMQRLVLAARAFVRRPPLMILDEPCTGLDEEHRRILLDTLERIAGEAKPFGGPTILLVTHDPEERLSCMEAHLFFYQDGYTGNGQPRYRWKFTRASKPQTVPQQVGAEKS